MKTKFILTLLLAFFTFTVGAFAQTEIIADNPKDYLGEGNTSLMSIALTIILSWFSGMIPFLNKYKGYVRAGAMALLVVGAFVIFKTGALNEATFKTVIQIFFPTFAYSGSIWEGLKWILSLIGVKIPTAQELLSKPTT